MAYLADEYVTLHRADVRDATAVLEPASVDAIITSPPYWALRDYGDDRQIGHEETPDEYAQVLADVLTDVAVHALKPTGSLWLNLGDTYSSGGRTSYDADDRNQGRGGGFRGSADLPGKSLLMIPERVAFALLDRGWILRSKVIWHRPNAQPESVTDRFSRRTEVIFHFVRAQEYFFDLEAVLEPSVDGSTRVNPGDVWTVPTRPYRGAHFATFPPDLVRRPLLATCPAEVCSDCGAPRKRLLARPCPSCDADIPVQAKQCEACGWRNTGWRDGRDTNEAFGIDPEGKTAGRATPRKPGGFVRQNRTVGWSDCGCGADWQPGVVLDPFAGSGTTLDVARQHGRRAVGIEVNEEYCALAASRFQQGVLDLGLA